MPTTTLSSIGSTLAAGTICFLTCFIAFGIANKYQSPKIAPRCTARPPNTIYNGNATATSINNSNNNHPQYRGHAAFGWMLWVYTLTDDIMLRGIPGTGTRNGGMAGTLLHVSLDGIVLIRFHALGRKMALCATILCVGILLPLYLTSPTCRTLNDGETDEGGGGIGVGVGVGGGEILCNATTTTMASLSRAFTVSNDNDDNDNDNDNDESNTTYDDADYSYRQTTLANVPDLTSSLFFVHRGSISLRLYAPVIVVWIITLYAFWLLHKEWIEMLHLRREYYLEQRQERESHNSDWNRGLLSMHHHNNNINDANANAMSTTPNQDIAPAMTAPGTASKGRRKKKNSFNELKTINNININVEEATTTTNNGNSNDDDGQEERRRLIKNDSNDYYDDDNDYTDNEDDDAWILNREPWIPHPEQPDTCPNVEPYSILLGHLPNLLNRITTTTTTYENDDEDTKNDDNNQENDNDEEKNNSTHSNSLSSLNSISSTRASRKEQIQNQLELITTLLERSLPHEPGYSSPVAAVTIIPCAHQVGQSWRKWYAAAMKLRRLQFIQSEIVKKKKLRQKQQQRQQQRRRPISSSSSRRPGPSNNNNNNNNSLLRKARKKLGVSSSSSSAAAMAPLASPTPSLTPTAAAAHLDDEEKEGLLGIPFMDVAEDFVEEVAADLEAAISYEEEDDEKRALTTPRAPNTSSTTPPHRNGGRKHNPPPPPPPLHRKPSSASSSSSSKKASSSTAATTTTTTTPPPPPSKYFVQALGSLVVGGDASDDLRSDALQFGPEQTAVYGRELAQSASNFCPRGCLEGRVRRANLETLLDMESDAIRKLHRAKQELEYARQNFLNVLERDTSSADYYYEREKTTTSFRGRHGNHNNRRNNNNNHTARNGGVGRNGRMGGGGVGRRFSSGSAIIGSPIGAGNSSNNNNHHNNNKMMKNKNAKDSLGDYAAVEMSDLRRPAARNSLALDVSPVVVAAGDHGSASSDGLMRMPPISPKVRKRRSSSIGSIFFACIRNLLNPWWWAWTINEVRVKRWGVIPAFFKELKRESAYAVVTFTSRQAAAAARQQLMTMDQNAELGRFGITLHDIPIPPLADAAAWTGFPCRYLCRPVTVTLNDLQKNLRLYIILTWLALMYIFYTIPLTYAASQVNPETIAWLFPEHEKLTKTFGINIPGVISGLATGLIWSLFFMLIPQIFKLISYFGSQSTSLAQAERKAMQYFWWFMVITAFMGPNLAYWALGAKRNGGKMSGGLRELLLHLAGTTPTLIAPTWLNWIIYRFTIILPINFLLQFNTFFFHFLGCNCCSRMTIGGGPGGPVPYRIFVDSGVVLMCTVALGPASPLVAPTALAYFLFCDPLLRRNVIFVYRPRYDDGGLRWVFCFNMIVSALVVGQLLLALEMGLKNAIGAGVLAALAIPTTIWFQWHCKSKYEPAFENTTLLRTNLIDGWDSLSNMTMDRREEHRRFLVDTHKAAYIPVCIAGSKSASILTSTPATVVPHSIDSDDDLKFDDVVQEPGTIVDEGRPRSRAKRA